MRRRGAARCRAGLGPRRHEDEPARAWRPHGSEPVAAARRPPAAPPLWRAGGPGPAPPPSRVGRRRSGGAILRCCGRRVGSFGGRGADGGGRDSINCGNRSGSGGGCGRCLGLASPFARPRGQDFADMSDVEENNFEGRVSGRPCRGRAEGRPGPGGWRGRPVRLGRRWRRGRV